jgi:hypothetical protein
MVEPKRYGKKIRSLTIDELRRERAFWVKELFSGTLGLSDDHVLDMIKLCDFNLSELLAIEKEENDERT